MRLQRQLPMTLALGAIITAVAMFEPGAKPASAGGGGCHSAPQTEGTGTNVSMVHGCFVPTVLRTEPGATVTFRNTDAWLHNVHGQTWDLPGDFMKDTTRALAFAEEGTYPYACAFHPGMTGVVIVGDGVSDSAATSNPVTAEPSGGVAEGAATTGNRQSTALWTTAALLTGAISAGAGGLWLGKRRHS